MVRYELEQAPILTEEQIAQLEKAERMPIVYDEDCPALTEEMAEAFRESRRKKPYRGEVLSLHISQAALEKAKTFGEDYIFILERLLDEAISKKSSGLEAKIIS